MFMAASFHTFVNQLDILFDINVVYVAGKIRLKQQQKKDYTSLDIRN
jgi:hypothetical protein